MKPERINLQSPVAYIVTLIIGTLGSLGSIGWLVVGTSASGPGRLPGAIGLGVFGLAAFIAYKHLSHGLEYLEIDVPAGTFTHCAGKQPTTVPLAELGPLTITKYNSDPQLRARVRQLVWWHKLEAAGLPRVILSDTIDPKPTEAMKAKFERAIAASAVRRILTTHAGGDAYRAAPEVRSQLAAAVPDAARLREALDLLAADTDPAIQARAKELRSS